MNMLTSHRPFTNGLAFYTMIFLVFFVLGLGFANDSFSEELVVSNVTDDFIADLDDDEDFLEDETVTIYDPLEPVNRVFFVFNDKLYFWLLRPVARGYSWIVPEPVRESVNNLFDNIKMPIRFVNNILQGKISESGRELARFAVNTTVGIGGLWDPASHWFDISPSKEDFGQTLGKYGIGEGVYICWPVLGPSNIRDTLGLTGDYFLNPLLYPSLNDEGELSLALKGTEGLNSTSLRIGEYEDFKEATFDPYTAMRDAHFQQRRSKIKDENVD
jgi:phospholipid-binding lipoprotein MlaA